MGGEPARQPSQSETTTSSPLEASGVIHLREGRSLRLRPIRADDEAALVEMAQRSTPEDRRFRFLSSMRPHLGLLSSRLAHVDQARHIALAAYDPSSPRSEGEILGVVRLVLIEDGRKGDFAVMVRSDLKGQRLGYGHAGDASPGRRARPLSG